MIDVQSRPDDRGICLEQVGVSDLQYPIVVLDREQANVNSATSPRTVRFDGGSPGIIGAPKEVLTRASQRRLAGCRYCRWWRSGLVLRR